LVVAALRSTLTAVCLWLVFLPVACFVVFVFDVIRIPRTFSLVVCALTYGAASGIVVGRLLRANGFFVDYRLRLWRAIFVATTLCGFVAFEYFFRSSAYLRD
jgi:hypothetical protein